jgi:hypothetical protein
MLLEPIPIHDGGMRDLLSRIMERLASFIATDYDERMYADY